MSFALSDLFTVQCGKCLLQAVAVFDVEHLLCAVNLSHEAAEDFAGANFDEGGRTAGLEQLDALYPADCASDLADEAVADICAATDHAGVDVAGDGNLWVVDDDALVLSTVPIGFRPRTSIDPETRLFRWGLYEVVGIRPRTMLRIPRNPTTRICKETVRAILFGPLGLECCPLLWLKGLPRCGMRDLTTAFSPVPLRRRPVCDMIFAVSQAELNQTVWASTTSVGQNRLCADCSERAGMKDRE